MQNSVASSVPLTHAAPARAMWGLFDRKERWSLSWRGRLILAFALLLVGALLLKGVYPFLATTHRVDTNVLVVEGWVHEYAIRVSWTATEHTVQPLPFGTGFVNTICPCVASMS